MGSHVTKWLTEYQNVANSSSSEATALLNLAAIGLAEVNML